ncbi:hypothetical protein PHSY_004584 [Pseudozyma hubeiensis SY62]|uniref:Uncharacterized protein n=1 Tax=Pseudozyma hubeiensis (strain SY62) TaxID=1305764 RepID=R9PFX8_PSEHS|nr:hypothetical protein PHSY_004584 [Pseudozyma hubeiensis SY62]GAC97000.1 hypothetical protein PHSY_004584 [Pseudozyma hubeiensis SY62]
MFSNIPEVEANSRLSDPPAISNSSSAESTRRAAPDTPPQLRVGQEPVGFTGAGGFGDCFPWMKPSFTTDSETSLHLPSSSINIQSPSDTRDAADEVIEEGSRRKPDSSNAKGGDPSALPMLRGWPLSPVASSFHVPEAVPTTIPVPDHAAPSSNQDECFEGEVLDLYEDDNLRGYQVWTRGGKRSNVMAIRIPRQMMGWKAILMDASRLEENPTFDTSKKARRASKVIGKQGWEVRQEALKNSYDFRRGSGIWATMHSGHRLFKHDWHIIIKDGSRYVWRMDKHALALYREGAEEADVKVAEFCRAMPASSPIGSHDSHGAVGRVPDDTKRVGSLFFQGQRSSILPGRSHEGYIFGISLAMASLVAVFGARGGHANVSAALEPSADPMRTVLEKQRQDEPDREQMMLALPRPGFARETESVLSDTTDEDAGETNDYHKQPGHSKGLVPDQHRSSWQTAQDAPPQTERKRFSSFFGKSSASLVVADEAPRSTDQRYLTASQRIARQYRTQSVFLGS